MFNKISNWCNKHQGILSLLSFIAIFYINWADSINRWLGNILNISFNNISSLLKMNLRVDVFLIFLLTYYLLNRFWIYIRTKEIKIIAARYYTANNTIDITDKIKDVVEKNKIIRFHLTNELAGIDPEPGKLKKMDLTYKCGWLKLNKTFGEGEWVNLFSS